MPSEEIQERVREALVGARAAFRSAVDAAVQQVRALIDANRTSSNGSVAPGTVELGAFASGRIDADRFAALLGTDEAYDEGALSVLERASETLRRLAERKDDLFVVHVGAGGSLRDTVAAALAEVGRAFGAARVVELVKSGRYVEEEHAALLAALPFARWNRAERRLVPPLAVHVDGPQVYAAALAEFLDGAAKLVLLVGAPCPPAPLARLVTPGTYVLQTVDGAGLESFAAWEGPGVAALVPEGAVRFAHDPAGGEHPWDRVRIESMPDVPPRAALGGLSASQQAEDLRLLAALAARPEVASGGASPAPAPRDPVDKLAAWLLQQADLTDLGT